MKCIHCGREIPDYSLFCTYCGKKIKLLNKPEGDCTEASAIFEKATATAAVLPKKKQGGARRGLVALFLAVALLLSVGANIYQLTVVREIESISADNEQLCGTVSALQQENALLAAQNEEANAEIVRLNDLVVSAEVSVEKYKEYCNQLQQQSEETKLAVDIYNEILAYVTNINGQRARSFNENSNFYTGSNMICVKTGESVTFNVFFAYNSSFDYTIPSNANINVSIGTSSGGNFPVTITGKGAGITQLHFFYLGNGGHSFDVLVVVLP